MIGGGRDVYDVGRYVEVFNSWWLIKRGEFL